MLVLPLGIVRIDEKTARYGPFFAKNQFSPADEFVLVGLVVRKCHFDVTAGALRQASGFKVVLCIYSSFYLGEPAISEIISKKCESLESRLGHLFGIEHEEFIKVALNLETAMSMSMSPNHVQSLLKSHTNITFW